MVPQKPRKLRLGRVTYCTGKRKCSRFLSRDTSTVSRISALDGDNVVNKSENTPWFTGQPLMEILETVEVSRDKNLEHFRFPVQYVTRPNLNFRGFCGTVASGVIRPGETVMALPSRRTSKV